MAAVGPDGDLAFAPDVLEWEPLGAREWGPVPIWRETPDRGEHSGEWQSCCRYPAGAVTGPLPTALRDRQQQQQQPQLQRSQLSYDQLSLLQWCL
jgi:hypothetical protein